MTSTGGIFTCGACSAKFKYRKHLQRHSVTHSAERPYKCVFCDAAFKRRDVLRKHFKTCATRLASGQEMPEETVPGKPVKSCDHCASFKKACDQKLPCVTCVSRNQACTYNRISSSGNTESGSVRQSELDQATLDASSDFGFDFLGTPIMDSTYGFSDSSIPEWWSWNQARPSLPDNERQSYSIPRTFTIPSPSPWRIQQGSKFDFLLNFTRTTGLQRVFNYPHQRRHRLMSDPSAQADAVTMVSEWDSFPSGSFSTQTQSDADNQLQDGSQSHSSSVESHNSDSSHLGMEQVIQWLDDPLFARTQELWNLFRPYLSELSNKSPVVGCKSENSEGQFLNFLSPPNLKRFVELFFNQWYPHCPILHKPTFNLATVPALLLAPVILMGACMSNDKDERLKGKLYAELVEKLVFSHYLLSLYSNSNVVDDEDLSPVKVMQAAYLLCLLQNWEGDDAAKKRIRQYRFITLIATVRDIGFSSANHNFRSPDAFKWTSFIEKEETVRTFTYIFLLDSAFLIFNNAPPKLMLQELEMDLTCPEEIFQAESAESCYDLLQFYQLGLLSAPWGSFSLVKAIDVLAGADHSPTNAELFAKMTTLNLFAIISGFHIILFQHRTLFLCPPSSLGQIRLAIERWKAAWSERNNVAYHSSMLEPWQEPGFIRHAHEFAYLALARLDNLEAQREQHPNTSVHSSSKAGFERLDETSMSQVTSLMLSLAVADD